MSGTIGKEFQDNECEYACRQALEQEQPLPAVELGEAVELKQKARKRRTDDKGERQADEKIRRHPGAIGGREPQCQIKDDAGIQAGLGGSQSEAKDVEADWSLDQRIGGGERTPDEQNREDPASGTKTHEDEIGRNLKQRIAQEEDAGPEAILRIGKTQIAVHRQRSKRYVHAIEIIDEI